MMKKIDLALLHDAATRLLFTMTEAQYLVLVAEFDVLLKQMALIGQIEGVDGLTPMTFPFITKNQVMRQDVVQTTLTQSEALQNVGNQVDGQMKLPKVVG
jgi:aspartyl/glutamyl-tRNA(Asn/Gln) amidotransferase C subunit